MNVSLLKMIPMKKKVDAQEADRSAFLVALKKSVKNSQNWSKKNKKTQLTRFELARHIATRLAAQLLNRSDTTAFEVIKLYLSQIGASYENTLVC